MGGRRSSAGASLGGGSSTAEAMMSHNHFPLSTSSKDAQPCIKVFPWFRLGLGSKASKHKIGIKVSPGKMFHCIPEIQLPFYYVYEAGVDPLHAKNLQHCIRIYVTCKGTKVLVGTLSAAHPKVQLDLVLGKGCELSHSSRRKAVYFNGYEVCKPQGPLQLETNKELWVAEVKPCQKLEFDPADERKEYHLLKVYSAKSTQENIKLHVQCNGERKLLGVLSSKDTLFHCRFEFDDQFWLSHSSETAVVIFWGYTVPLNFDLKDLSDNPEDSPVHKPPKRSVDAEYRAYQALLAKGDVATVKQPEVELSALSPVPSPLIIIPRS